MNRLFCLIGGVAVAALPVAAEWSRYEGIVLRSPFGSRPPEQESSATEQEVTVFANQYRLCFLAEDEQGGVCAGIVNKLDDKAYLLRVGETGGGISLADVRLADGLAVVERDGVSVRLVLEEVGRPSGVAQSTGPGVAVASANAAPARLFQRTGSALEANFSSTGAQPQQPRLVVRSTRPAAGSAAYAVQGVPQRYLKH
jgi:hypothetical protein